jgi:glycosyltransferase involved in cell wall biosynthesis
VVRILYDHQVFSLQNAGGASRYHYELLKYLAGLPEVHTELLLGISGSVYPLRDLASERVTVMSLAGSLPPGMRRFLVNEAFGNAVAPFRGKMDVYHPTLYRCMPLVRAQRIVATHHDCVHERFPELFPDVGKVLRAKKRLYAQADAIICVSESSRKDLLEFYPIDAAKTRVIYHGMTPLPRDPGAAGKLPRQARREYLLYVGSRAAYKNFAGLLQAFRESGLQDSLDLLVFGGGPLTPAETALIAELGLSNCVSSIREASDELLREAYAGAKLFVYPSLCEGFGFPPLEAMAAGCPVLASNTSAIPEVCLDAPFYFDPLDRNSLVRGLLQAVNDEEARRKAVARGSQVIARYSWTKCGQETLALYRECQ